MGRGIDASLVWCDGQMLHAAYYLCMCNYLNRIELQRVLFFSSWTKLQPFISIHYKFRHLTISNVAQPFPHCPSLNSVWLTIFFGIHWKARTWVHRYFFSGGCKCAVAATVERNIDVVCCWWWLAGWFSRLMIPQISLFLIPTPPFICC